MLFSQKPQDIRKFYIESFRKFKNKEPLSALEQQIVDVILAHPEYHDFLETKEAIHAQFFPELGQTNPFMHMGLHLAIREQVMTQRPQGIERVYKALVQKLNGPLEAEHQMIEVLAECLWTSQRNQTPPDEKTYLSALEELLKA